MQTEKVLLRRSDGQVWQEVGRFTDSRGKVLNLKLPDGSIVEHERGKDEITPNAGSIIHLSRVAPDVMIGALEQDPAMVYTQVLHEARKGMRAIDLKQKLRDVAGDQLDASWDAARPALTADPDVVVSKGSPPTYTYRGDSVPGFVNLFPVSTQHESDGRDVEPEDVPQTVSRRETDSEEISETPTPATETGPHDVPRTLDAPPDERPRSSAEAERSGRAKGEEPVTHVAAESPPLVSALAALLPDVLLTSFDDVAGHLMEVGDRFGKLTAREQGELVDDLTVTERRLLAIACGAAKQGLLEPQVRELTVEDYQGALEAAIREILRTDGDPRPLKSAANNLLERAHAAGDLPVDLLARLGRCFAHEPAHPQGLARSLELVAAQIRALEDVGAMRTWDLGALARAARSAPFTRTDGRTALVAALYARDQDEAVRDRWWENSSLTELAEAGQGPLARTLGDERVAATVVDPLLAAYLKDATSRSAVATLWLLPRPLASRVSGDQMARLLATLGERDQVVNAWMRTLTSQDRFTTLEQEATDLRSRLRVQDEAVTSLTGQVERLEEQVRRAGDQLAAFRQAESSQRGARDRQLRVDLVRTLALLIAQVQQSPAATADAALVRQVQHLSRREGLDPVGHVGETLPFDPAAHEPLTPSLVSGTPASVVRCGYTWAHDGEQVILLKAQVVSQGG